jgi:hypothetical protein
MTFMTEVQGGWRKPLPGWLGIAIALSTLVGCGGGGGGAAAAPPAAQPPRLFGLASVTLDQDTSTAPLAFRVVDADTPAAQLELGLTTSNAALLPLSGIVVRGDGADRSIVFTPTAEATGTANVTVILRDPGGLMDTSIIGVQVRPVLVSFKSLTNESFVKPEGGELAKVSGVTVQPDADEDPTAFDALLR